MGEDAITVALGHGGGVTTHPTLRAAYLVVGPRDREYEQLFSINPIRKIDVSFNLVLCFCLALWRWRGQEDAGGMHERAWS